MNVVILLVLINVLSLLIHDIIVDLTEEISRNLAIRRIMKSAPACINCKRCSDWKYNGHGFMVRCDLGKDPKANSEDCKCYIER